MDLVNAQRHTRRGFLRGGSAPKFVPLNLVAQSDSAPVLLPPAALFLSTPGPETLVPPAPIEMVGNYASLAAVLYSFEPGAEFGDDGYFYSADNICEDVDDLDCIYGDISDDPVVSVIQKSAPSAARVLTLANGWRVEHFDNGSRIVKNELGKVMEVHSPFGDSLHLRYGRTGLLDGFDRLLVDGTLHSKARSARNQIVVQDPSGRVCATGDTLFVNPRGALYLHANDGQYFSIDLIDAVYRERRKIEDKSGTSRFVTSIFAHDGFCMAIVFSAARTVYGALRKSHLRFFGRDGAVIDFAAEDDVRQLRPLYVSAPAHRPLGSAYANARQARTAWDAVYQYLSRAG